MLVREPEPDREGAEDREAQAPRLLILHHEQQQRGDEHVVHREHLRLPRRAPQSTKRAAALRALGRPPGCQEAGPTWIEYIHIRGQKASIIEESTPAQTLVDQPHSVPAGTSAAGPP